MHDLTDLVLELTREILDADGIQVESLGAETPLFGPNGVLDSMGIVSLVVAVEQGIEDRHGMAISLADEKALSQSRGPYRTVASLAEYASQALANAT